VSPTGRPAGAFVAVAAWPAVLAQGPTFVEGDLSSRGHVFIVVATTAALAYILRLVRRRRMEGRYAVLWTSVGVVLVVLAVWPGLLTTLSEVVGVHYPPTLFLLVLTGFLFVVVVHFSYELSRLQDRSRTLAEEVALLRAEREFDLPGHGEQGTTSAAVDEPT
jgi:hypothetical protein